MSFSKRDYFKDCSDSCILLGVPELEDCSMYWDEIDLDSNKGNNWLTNSWRQNNFRSWLRSADSNINLDDYNDDPDLVYYEKNLFVVLQQSKYLSSKSQQNSDRLEFDSQKGESFAGNNKNMKQQVLSELQSKTTNYEENSLDKSLNEKDESNHFKQIYFKESEDILFDRPNLKISSVINSKNEEAKTFVSPKQSIQYQKSVEAIESCYIKWLKIQMQINQTGKFKKKVGRPSNYVPNKSFILKDNLNKFLRKEFENLINDNIKGFRVDLLATSYFRIVKKIPYYFTRNCCTMNLFKEKNIFKWIKGYVEAASAFNFAQGNYDDCNIIKRVVEFWVIYFSEAKCNTLINRLLEGAESELAEHLKSQK